MSGVSKTSVCRCEPDYNGRPGEKRGTLPRQRKTAAPEESRVLVTTSLVSPARLFLSVPAEIDIAFFSGLDLVAVANSSASKLMS